VAIEHGSSLSPARCRRKVGDETGASTTGTRARGVAVVSRRCLDDRRRARRGRDSRDGPRLLGRRDGAADRGAPETPASVRSALLEFLTATPHERMLGLLVHVDAALSCDARERVVGVDRRWRSRGRSPPLHPAVQRRRRPLYPADPRRYGPRTHEEEGSKLGMLLFVWACGKRERERGGGAGG
jgi:hypothetical protein